jgi:Mn-dependent DtxR family transcriptional regulator
MKNKVFYRKAGDCMKKITQSNQDYLEALLNLSNQGTSIRSVDIAATLGFSRASVNRAMNVLKEAGYIVQQKYGTITLTPLGIEAALQVKKRHNLLKMFLIDVLKVTPKVAEEDACRMEHAISVETSDKLECYLHTLASSQENPLNTL